MKLQKIAFLLLFSGINHLTSGEDISTKEENIENTQLNQGESPKTAITNPVALNEQEIQELLGHLTVEERGIINQAFETIFRSVANNLDHILTQEETKKEVIERAKKILNGHGIDFMVNMGVQFIKQGTQPTAAISEEGIDNTDETLASTEG
jgi:hypothetical protein